MESPPSFSGHSEAPAISEDSGLIVTSGSISSDSVSGLLHIPSELQESDCDDKSLSQYDFQDATDHMCCDNFNTVKKGPAKISIPTIEPPLQFQDSPKLQQKATELSNEDKSQATGTMPFEQNQLFVSNFRSSPSELSLNSEKNADKHHSLHRYTSPRLLHLSPCHGNVRPSSRGSLQTPRKSSSHNSLTTQTEADDSSFITQAISHDTLSTGTSDIADMYNVPFDSDMYSLPIDSVAPSRRLGFQRNTLRNPICNPGQANLSCNVSAASLTPKVSFANTNSSFKTVKLGEIKRHSIPCTSKNNQSLTNDSGSTSFFDKEMDVQSLKSNTSETGDRVKHPVVKHTKTTASPKDSHNNVNNNIVNFDSLEEKLDIIFNNDNTESNSNVRKHKKHLFSAIKHKKQKESSAVKEVDEAKSEESKNDVNKQIAIKKSPVKSLSLNFKQTLCKLFRFKKTNSVDGSDDESPGCSQETNTNNHVTSVTQRALPSVPMPTPKTCSSQQNDSGQLDFPTSIQIVKDYGWYWGPISVEASEKLLSVEPEGSFILRDSSDPHYIFTLSFKLSGGVRHVRIEHDQGKFCFGSCTMFKARTIVEFIENAVETSRSGRYLFFLNLRPVLGPVRVQLLYPVSRFMRVQSLQHMCRFVILKHVRRDRIIELTLPRRIIDYLSTPQYYSESLMDS